MLPDGRVVRAELVVRLDEAAEQRMVVRERLEADSVGDGAREADPALVDRRGGSDVEVEERGDLGVVVVSAPQASGSNPSRLVNRQCSSRVVGSGRAL